MEDMARLAVVEQSVQDVNKFNKLLYELLQHISYILENPDDYDLRTLKSDVVGDLLMYDTFTDYLKYLGFKLDGSHYVYPKDLTLNNLRMAQAAIERKINFCSGKHIAKLNFKSRIRQAKKTVLKPTKILNTKNSLLLRIEDLFNIVLEYEDEDLQALARDQIPLVTLQLMALDRVREQQKKIKTGETKEKDLPFDMALLLELMGWFKYKFFSWVDQPPCDVCAGPTVFNEKISGNSDGETCAIEVYKCKTCGPEGGALFPRYNRPATLLRTRRGRCGEWANCFALLCRSLGYDTRYIYDTTDHVWCEVFDYESKTWLHVDPCEGKLNAPLIYEHGWGKKLCYVIAIARDDLQDVTWRYTTNHKQVLARRKQCSEQELLSALMSLRNHRQLQLSEARRGYLVRRTLLELVSLMQERKPTDYESHGRISGSKQWRSDRGEVGKSHTFLFSTPGTHTVTYNSGSDTYLVLEPEDRSTHIKGWISGVYHTENIFRKVETDWQQVYLAREEGEAIGSVSWRFAANDTLRLTNIQMRINTAVYENGSIHWSVQYDNNEPQSMQTDENAFVLSLSGDQPSCRSVTVRAELRGGSGDHAWQHAQLCRSPLAEKTAAMYFCATLQID